MLQSSRRNFWSGILLVSLALTGCGGGSSNDNQSTTNQTITRAMAQEPGAPQATGDTATDGLAWFNFRRQQMGVAPLVRNANLDAAAQGHSNYQRRNNIITHVQTEGAPGFTGKTLVDRLAAANYHFSTASIYAYGEVIASTSSTSGFSAAEDLIAAIYHRFVVFEPMFKEFGAGAATVKDGNTYSTTNFAANNGLAPGLGERLMVTYPYANQTGVPRNFFSDNESPDPVASRNEVGYPISVHADITSTVAVQSFTVAPRGGTALPVQLLVHASDANTSESVAAIIPLAVLPPATIFDVRFVGTVNGIPVNREWSFTTQ